MVLASSDGNGVALVPRSLPSRLGPLAYRLGGPRDPTGPTLHSLFTVARVSAAVQTGMLDPVAGNVAPLAQMRRLSYCHAGIGSLRTGTCRIAEIEAPGDFVG